MSDAQERFSYHAAKAVDWWILEKRAEENGQNELAAQIKQSAQYDINKAEQARGEIDEAALKKELNTDVCGKDCFGQ